MRNRARPHIPRRNRRIVVSVAAGTALAAMLGTPGIAGDGGRRVIAAVPGLEVALEVPAAPGHRRAIGRYDDRYGGGFESPGGAEAELWSEWDEADV